ncbi:glutamate--tRNA ligase [Asticcacaulis endophyticus]|uniref:Glutamate--tRNA ligase n=1 Tax=Asticcacaulis endophyticus TaxID=1395890 RepID=A0A918Q7F3_9CAUL|nr:glutamate--tRNA ligase [Asticcacaulis endophyticus]GGZ36848.1 glutamate--tRNA ligase [Asticcacaulis endophyticus]
MTVKVRFAPSPTGRIHAGNVRAALINWLFAKKQQGLFVLRIDDTDLERSTKENEDLIETDLKWLGLNWDERYNQSKRFDIYQKAADALKADGRLYACYETADELDRRRKVQLSRGLPPVYDRAALNLTEAEKAAFEAEGRKPHWRFKLDGKRVAWEDLVRGHCEVDTTSMSDPVLIREDGAFLYTLPSVVDDIDMKITHVIRGEDHVANTGTQIEIFEALSAFFGGAPLPTFAHMTLLVGADGEGLSKRLGSMSISQMREDGLEPLAITSHLAKIGTSDPLEVASSLEVLAEAQDFTKMGRAPARYDFDDLMRLNAGVLQSMSYAEAKLRLEALSVDLGELFWDTIKPNLHKFAEVVEWAAIVRDDVATVIEDAGFAAKALELLPDDYGRDSWSAWTAAIKDATGAKGKALFMPLRLALTGKPHGPDMGALSFLIGREKIAKRLGASA